MCDGHSHSLCFSFRVRVYAGGKCWFYVVAREWAVALWLFDVLKYSGKCKICIEWLMVPGGSALRARGGFMGVEIAAGTLWQKSG